MTEKRKIEPEDWKTVSRLLDAALDLPPAERAAWLDRLEPSDAVHRGTIERLLASLSRADDAGFLASPAPLDVATPALERGVEIGAYRLDREIGRGGMGTVWLADRSDGRFERRVAVKFLSVALTGRSGQERFRREGRILGALHHPHIAELADAGVTETGHPYLVLEYVEGEPIDAYSRSRDLDLQARLHLFLDVLAAVAHAHANLIVHRDLKPSNVLVRTDGQVKLLDFGIAKLLGQRDGAADAALTGDGMALTPLHAAPEQLRGEPVTTATDVYALGVLLYLMLTGSHPAGPGPHAPADLMHAIVDKDAPRLSDAPGLPDKLRRQLRGDLDTIVARTLKKDPGARYASVTALDEDLRRHLRHEPIRARPDTLLYRAAKFLARNRVTVAAVTLATLALVVTAGVAVRRGIEARHRFDQVRKMAHTFLFDFYDELERVTGTTKAKELLAATAREYLDNLARSAGDDRDLSLELAEAYERLAAVQGGSNVSLNQRDAALESRMRAIEIRSRLTGRNQAQDGKLVTLLFAVADDLRNFGRLDEALEMGHRAVETGDALVRGGPPETQVPLGSAHVILGRVLLELGRLAEAEAEFETAEHVFVTAGGDKVLRQLVVTRLDRADALLQLGRLNETVHVLEQAERDAERLVAEAEPGTPLLRSLRIRLTTWASLAVAYDNPLAPSLDQPQLALGYRDKLRQGWEYLISLDPSNDDARNDLAVCDSETAVTLLKVDPRAAVGMAAGAQALFEDLARTRPEDSHLAYRSARGATRLALALLADGRASEALPPIESSTRMHRELLAREDNPPYRSSLVWSLTVLGRIEQALHHDAAARAALEEAVRFAEPLTGSADLLSLRAAAEAHQTLGAAITGDDRCRSLERARDIWDGWSAGSSPWVDARRDEAARLVAACRASRS